MDAICDELTAETDDLVAVLSGLRDDQWDLDTPSPGWTVRDQISHLTFFDGTGLLAATDAEAFANSTRALMSGTGEVTDAGISQGRAWSAAQVLEAFVNARTKMTAVFRTLDPKARLPWYGPPMGALSFATARLMETWAHGQDIVDAVGASRPATDRLRHVAHIGVRARPFSYVTNGRVLPEGDVAVRLHAPSGATWEWNIEAADHDLVEGAALDFCLMVTQRRHVADTNLDVSGPLANDWIPIAQAFAGGPGEGRQPGQFS
jgi:uncharacterized protein (TIGR03084 family)